MISASSQLYSIPSALSELALGGFSRFPPAQLADLAESCWSWAESSGDPRYYVLFQVLHLVADAWPSDDSGNGIPGELAASLESELKASLIGILDEVDTETANSLAVALKGRVILLLGSDQGLWPTGADVVVSG